MQKKRVRIYKPKFQMGGAMQSPDYATDYQGQTYQDILTSYADLQQMSEEEKLGLMSQFDALSQMEKQQFISQITDKMISSAQAAQATGSMYKAGGKIGQAKKLLHKAIGGATVGQNVTSDNVIENRNQQIKNAIGANVARSYVDEAYQEAQQANQAVSYNPMMQQGFQMGGYTNGSFYGGYENKFANPFILNRYKKDLEAQEAGKLFKDSLLSLGSAFDYAGTKVKTRGEMFNRGMSKTPVVNTDPTRTMTSNEMAETMFGLKYGGSLPRRAYGGEEDEVVSEDGKGLIDIGNSNYDPATKSLYTYDGELIRVVDDAEDKSILDQFGNSNTSNELSDETGSTDVAEDLGGYNYHTGSLGGFYVQDGYIIDPNTGALMGTAGGASNVMQLPQGNYMFNRTSPIVNEAGAKLFAQNIQEMQPDDVYMSKFKSRTGPFGNKVKMTWDYGTEGESQNFFDKAKSAFTRGEDEGPTPKMGSGLFNRMRSNYLTKNPERLENRRIRNEERAFRKFGIEPESSQPAPVVETTEEDLGMRYGGTPRMGIGGRAGKLVIKDTYSAQGATKAGALTTGLNALAANKEKRDAQEDEAMYTVDRWMPVLEDSRERNPMSRGLWGTGALIGEETPDLQPANYGYRWSQGSGNLLSGQSGYSGYSKYGGKTYQEGGVYYLDDDEVQEIFRNGGSIEYI
jgi:hypothetical protein